MPARTRLVRSLAAALLLAAGGLAQAATDHLTWAESVAANVLPANNAYASNPSYLQWPGVNGASTWANRTQCSTFLTQVLKQAYGYSDTQLRTAYGSSSPTAARYHDLIEAGTGFTPIASVYQIQAGDVIAIKYPEGEAVTGHIMIARGPATLRSATAPLVNGSYQFEIEVIDSSKSGHGPTDTRRQADGSWVSGAGIGVFRLYADGDGNLLGHTWSNYSNSLYYPQSVRHLVVGRLP